MMVMMVMVMMMLMMIFRGPTWSVMDFWWLTLLWGGVFHPFPLSYHCQRTIIIIIITIMSLIIIILLSSSLTFALSYHCEKIIILIITSIIIILIIRTTQSGWWRQWLIDIDEKANSNTAMYNFHCWFTFYQRMVRWCLVGFLLLPALTTLLGVPRSWSGLHCWCA